MFKPRVFLNTLLSLTFLTCVVVGTTAEASTQQSIGSYYLSQQVDGQWEELYVQPYTVQYETHEFDFTPQNGTLTLRIDQENVSYADIEHLDLQACGQSVQPDYVRYTDTGESVLEDILYDDHNVTVMRAPIEVRWTLPDGCAETVTLVMKANEYESPEEYAFRFPEWGVTSQTYTFQNNGSFNLDGRITEVDGIVEPDYSPFWKAGTGHPSNNTHIYMRDDADYVYAAVDILLDNTNEFGQDWLKIIVQNSTTGEEKEYRVDDFSDEYGACAFGLTRSVPYKHQTCEIRIPKSEIAGSEMEFVMRYYGTGGGSPSLAFQNMDYAEETTDTTPSISGNIRALDGASAANGVSFGHADDQDLEEGNVVANYEGTCTADDGTFDSTNEAFTCTMPELEVGEYRVFLYATNGSQTATNSNTMFDVIALTVELTPVTDPTSDTTPTVSGTVTDETGGTVENVYFSTDEPDAFDAFVKLYDFGSGSDGDTPFYSSPIIVGTKIYGTTSGSTSTSTLYSVDLDGTDYEVLHDFAGNLFHYGGVVHVDGVLYGMTSEGGSESLGMIYSINIDGSDFTVIKNLEGATDEGAYPNGTLVYYEGLLYGTTNGGGANDAGTIFSIQTDGSNYNVIYDFAEGGDNGSYPIGDPIIEEDVIYGMTYGGGDDDLGTIFTVNIDGSGFAILHEFNGTNGSEPRANLTLVDGVLYGTAQTGGNESEGVIFSIDQDGSDYTILKHFDGGVDGGRPSGTLIYKNNLIYGTAYDGGGDNIGVLFRIGLNGTNFEVLRSLSAGTNDGTNPYGAFFENDGLLYGAASIGGTNNLGTLFSIGDQGAHCTADDGTFDETSEDFTCTVLEELEEGEHTIYVRALSSSGYYSDTESDTFIIGSSPTSTPTPTPTPTPTTTPSSPGGSSGSSSSSSSGSNSEKPQIPQGQSKETGGAFKPIKDSYTGGQQATVIVEPGTFKHDAFFSAVKTEPEGPNAVLKNPLAASLPDGAFTSGNAVNAAGILGVRQACGVAWQGGSVQQMWYKTYPPAGTNVKPAIIIPELQDKPSIISLGYDLADLIPPGNPTKSFDPASLKLAHSLDGATWMVMPTSIVDQENRTVAALDKLGGFYMIVSACQPGGGIFQPLTGGTALGASAGLPSTDSLDEPEKPLKEVEAVQPETKKATQPAHQQSFLQKVVSFVRGLFK